MNIYRLRQRVGASKIESATESLVNGQLELVALGKRRCCGRSTTGPPSVSEELGSVGSLHPASGRAQSALVEPKLLNCCIRIEGCGKFTVCRGNQLSAQAADVIGLDQRVFGELVLETVVVVFRVRRAEVGIHNEGKRHLGHEELAQVAAC